MLSLVVVTRSTWLIVVDFSWGRLPSGKLFHGGNRSIREESKRGAKSPGFFLSNDNASERRRVSLSVRLDVTHSVHYQSQVVIVVVNIDNKRDPSARRERQTVDKVNSRRGRGEMLRGDVGVDVRMLRELKRSYVH